jgi:hypothetical protein
VSRGTQPQGLGALGAAGLEQRVEELGTARAVVVELESDLADEADPERTAGHVGDGDVGVPHVGEGLGAYVVVGQAFEDHPGVRACEEDRPELGGLIEQMHVEVPAVDPVAEPRLHGRCASGGRAEVEAAVVQGGEETVVDHVAGLIEPDEVARAAGGQIANADGEHPIHQLRGIASGDQELPQGADIEQPGPVADRADLLLDVAEGRRSRP